MIFNVKQSFLNFPRFAVASEGSICIVKAFHPTEVRHIFSLRQIESKNLEKFNFSELTKKNQGKYILNQLFSVQNS